MNEIKKHIHDSKGKQKRSSVNGNHHVLEGTKLYSHELSQGLFIVWYHYWGSIDKYGWHWRYFYSLDANNLAQRSLELSLILILVNPIYLINNTQLIDHVAMILKFETD